MFNELIAILNILVYMSVIIHVDSQKHNNKVCLKASKTLNLSEMDRWIEYESLIFVVTLLSIPMFLLFKAFVNHFLGSFKFTLAYKSAAGCADALDKNYHESRLYQTYFTNVVVAAYMIAKQNSLEKDGLQIIESRLKDFMKAMLVLNALNLAYICAFLTVSVSAFKHNSFEEFEAGLPLKKIKQLVFLVCKILLTLSTLVYFFYLIGFTIYH